MDLQTKKVLQLKKAVDLMHHLIQRVKMNNQLKPKNTNLYHKKKNKLEKKMNHLTRLPIAIVIE